MESLILVLKVPRNKVKKQRTGPEDGSSKSSQLASSLFSAVGAGLGFDDDAGFVAGFGATFREALGTAALLGVFWFVGAGAGFGAATGFDCFEACPVWVGACQRK